MWVFDGEDWTEEGGASSKPKADTTPRFDEFMPELQIVEIVPVPLPRKRDVPHPMP